MFIEIYRKERAGRHKICPICKQKIMQGELRLETYIYGEKSRSFHLVCAKGISRKILQLIKIEEEGR